MASAKTSHPSPRPATATSLNTAAEYFQPETSHLVHEAADAVTVAGDGMIIQPALDNASQPTGRFAKRPGTHMSEAQKVESFRPARPASFSVPDRKATKLDQTRLPFVQLQAKLGEPRVESFQTRRRFAAVCLQWSLTTRRLRGYYGLI